MSKINGLVKKIEQFERLSLFGNRRDFLKSVAQDYAGIADNTALQGSIDALRTKLLEWSKSSGERLEGIGNLMPKKVMGYYETLGALRNSDLGSGSLAQMNAIVSALAQMSFNDNGAWVQSVLPTLSQASKALTSKQNQLSAVVPPANPESNVAGPAPKAVSTSTLPSIPKDIQQRLSDLMMPAGLLAVPLKVDGALGPDTQKALNTYKKHFKLENASTNELYHHIRTLKSIVDTAKENQDYVANRQ